MGVLNSHTLTTMEPEMEVPLVFRCWEKWLHDAGICRSIMDVDFIEAHAFGYRPKTPNPLAGPEGFKKEQERLCAAYSTAYRKFFKESCPDDGVPGRFTVHVVDVPDEPASSEL